MGVLLYIRDAVLALLERARADKYAHFLSLKYSLEFNVTRLIRNSLEATVDIIVPNGLVDTHETINLLFAQGLSSSYAS